MCCEFHTVYIVLEGLFVLLVRLLLYSIATLLLIQKFRFGTQLYCMKLSHKRAEYLGLHKGPQKDRLRYLSHFRASLRDSTLRRSKQSLPAV